MTHSGLLDRRGQSIKAEVEVLGLELHKKLAELGLGISPTAKIR